MYSSYWQLRELPFESIPNPRFLYHSENHEEALMRLIYTVKGRKGSCLLTGVVGCGKTTISEVFREKMRAEGFPVGMVTNPNLSAMELLQEILHALGVQSGLSLNTKIQLRHDLQELAITNQEAGKETVVIIDEAQLIEAGEAFEELRLLLNLHRNNRFLLTLILTGQVELKQLIDSIPQFAQRIAIRYHLNPLDLDDTCNYIRSRLEKAGCRREIFTEAAMRQVYEHSRGVPRIINNTCDMSLLAGFIARAGEIDQAIVERVVREEN